MSPKHNLTAKGQSDYMYYVLNFDLLRWIIVEINYVWDVAYGLYHEIMMYMFNI